MGRHDAAIPIYRRALALRPDFPEAFAHLVHSMQAGGPRACTGLGCVCSCDPWAPPRGVCAPGGQHAKGVKHTQFL